VHLLNVGGHLPNSSADCMLDPEDHLHMEYTTLFKSAQASHA